MTLSLPIVRRTILAAGLAGLLAAFARRQHPACAARFARAGLRLTAAFAAQCAGRKAAGFLEQADIFEPLRVFLR